jgi:hypothetical protein
VRVFLSYHTPDEVAAKALKHAIEANDPDIKVFFAPYNLKLGAFWLPVLGEAIAEANAFLIILGKQLGEWQKLEYYEAIDRTAKARRSDASFPLVPIKISERAPNLPFLSQFHWIESAEPTAVDSLSKIVHALRGKEVAAVAEPWRTVNPYRGLEALREEDAEFFFGRDDKTAEILQALAARRGRLCALIGNSGVGKSSLVQAGAIGALKRQRWPGDGSADWPRELGDSRAWAYLTMKPGDKPMRALAGAFTSLWFEDPTDPTRLQRTDEWEARLNDKGRISELIDASAARFRQLGIEPPRRILLYVDQGEELYSRTSKDDARGFSRTLAEGLKDERLVAMTSLRSDYYGHLQANESLFQATERIDVPPLGAREYEAVLREPARRFGVAFESEMLVEHIVGSARDQPGALPLLADIMTEIWKRMQERGDRLLRVTDRKDIIQVGHALARRADSFLQQNTSQEYAARDLFTLKLVSIPEQGEPLRRRALRTECSDHEWQLVDTLAEPSWRILVTGESEGVPTAEVAHEVILSKWDTLRKWLTEERDFLIWKGNVERALKEWRAAPFYMKRDALLSGNALFEARRWIKSKYGYLGRETQRFVKKSVHRKRMALIMGTLGAITVVLFIASSAMFAPLTASYNELLRTNPAEAEKLWSAPEYFWTVTLFSSLMFAILLWIVVFFLFILKWSTYALLRVLRERRSRLRGASPASATPGTST